MFNGAFTALVTPFANGKVDHDKLRETVDWQIEQGINGLVPCGTTGECATLTHDEHTDVLRTVLKQAGGRVPVIAGTGSNSTAEAIQLTRAAQNMGADAALVITPYYNKPSQEGLFRHFAAIAEATQLPLVLYNVPSRTAVNMESETVARLGEYPNIVAIKEASGDLYQIAKIINTSKLTVLSGDDALTVEMMELGAKGVISVTANVVPGDMARLVALKSQGKNDEAAALDAKLRPLHAAMFVETSPQPAKTALKLLGKSNGEMRLPMWGVSEDSKAQIEKALKDYGLL